MINSIKDYWEWEVNLNNALNKVKAFVTKPTMETYRECLQGVNMLSSLGFMTKGKYDEITKGMNYIMANQEVE